MSVYDDDIEGAEEDIGEFGADAQIFVQGASTGDENDPRPGAWAGNACKALQSNFSLRERESTLIKDGDRKFLISTEGLSITPTTDHEFAFNGETTRGSIESVRTVAPNGQIILHVIQVRYAS